MLPQVGTSNIFAESKIITLYIIERSDFNEY
jgi:hypothetical protein